MFIYLAIIDNPYDKALFETIYYQYRKELYYIALQILNNEDEAEDALHDAFVSLIRYMDCRNISKQRAHSFMLDMVRYRSIDRLRKRTREFKMSFGNGDYTGSSAEDKAAAQMMHEYIAKCISMLPVYDRVILRLRLYEGFSFKQIAAILNEKQDTVKKRFYRSRDKLVTMVKEGGWINEEDKE